MLIYNPDNDEYKFYDYKDCSPFSNEKRQGDIGVPGFVAGMEKISKDLGTKNISDLIGYSVDLAKNGVTVNADTVKAMNSFSNLLAKDKDYVKDGELLKEGDTLVQSELATTLEKIQNEGAKAFYSGEIAENIAKAGSMKVSDLEQYEVKTHEPVSGEFNGYKVVSAPPPFSGTSLIQMLEIIEQEVNTKDTTRAAAYELWMKAPNPMVTFFKTFDVTNLIKVSRKRSLKFHMLLDYCIGRAAVKVKEFYILPVGDKLIQYDTIAVNTIVKNKEGEVSSCDLSYKAELNQFNEEYLKYTAQVAASCQDRDLSENSMVIGTSAIIDTEIDGAVGMNSGIFNNPFIIWGRYRKKWFRYYLPVSFQFHHTQMDGAHAGKFLSNLQDEINNL